MSDDAQGQYRARAAADAFVQFSEEQGEKALLWGYVRRLIASEPGQCLRVLDFGCGTGWLASRAAAFRGVEAVGYDPSVEMIAAARKSGGARFVSSVMEAGDHFDLVVAVFVTPAISTEAELAQMLGELKSCSRQGGTVAVFAANPKGVFARHAFFESRRPAKLRRGAAYETDILDRDGKTLLTVTDYYWPSDLIMRLAANVGLRPTITALISDPVSRSGDQSRFPYCVYEFSARS